MFNALLLLTRYDGQWWSIGSFACNVLFFLTPAFLYLILEIENVIDLYWKIQIILFAIYIIIKGHF